MKKLLAILLTVAMLFSVAYTIPITASAQEIEVPDEAPLEIETDFGVEEVDESILEDEATDDGVLYAEIERYAGDKDNTLEKVTERYEASFASALSYYMDVEEFKEYVIDAFDTCTTSQVNINSFRIPTSKWDDLCNLIFYDIPELFHVKTLSGSYSGSYLTAIQVKQYPTFCDTASEYATLYNRSVEVAYQLLSGIRNNSNLTDLQKMILLHDRIATYCEYDPNQLSNGEYREQDYGMTGVFVDKVAVCQGYACAYNFLLKEVEIESYQCRSTALCHAWNLVKVGSYYYHVDITWDDTGSPLDSRGRVYHNNFLRSNAGIRATGHTAYDYDTPTNDSTYDSCFWQNSDTEFVIVGGVIYYYDSTCGDLKTYSGAIRSNQSTWTYGRILADGNYIYITTSSQVKRYDTIKNTTTTVYTPSLPSGHEIYGLYKDGDYIYCTTGSTSTSTQTSRLATASVNSISANNNYNANISSPGQIATYEFVPTVSGKYVIYSTGNADTKVSLCDSNGNEITSNDDGGEGSNFRLEYNLNAGTVYQYKVRYFSNSKTGTINFKFGNVFKVSYNANGGSGAPSSQTKDYGTNITLSTVKPVRSGSIFRGWSTSSSATTATYQPGDSFSNEANTTLYAVWAKDVQILQLNKTYGVTISSGSKLAQFTPTKTAKYIIHSNYIREDSDSFDTKVSLYDENGNCIARDDNGGEDLNFQLVHDLEAGQTYFFEVSFADQSDGGYFEIVFGSTYSVTYNANGGKSAPKPGVKGYKASMTLTTWKPTRSGYVFLGWATSKKATTATYKRGGTYPATINSNTTLYAVWKKGSLGATAVLKGKLLDHDTVKVFWRAVPGADGYKVYYKKASAKSYKYVGIIKGTSYTNNFTAGTKYNFKIIPCMEDNNHTVTNGKAKTLTYSTARVLDAPSWLTATLYGYDDVQLKWGKVPYATKYKIYYKKNGASSYTYKGMTSSTSYKIANLTDGALYNFAVLPCMSVNGSYYDAAYYRWIERYTLKKVPTPKIYKYSSSRILIEIDNILGETGYEISKSTSKNGTNIVYTIIIADPDSVGGYYHKDLYAPKGKTYYYKVRAYSVENGKKIYGPWSTAVKYKMS